MDKPIPEAVVKAAQTAYVAACAAGQKPCPRCGGTRRERDNYTECSVCEGAGWKWDESAPSPMQAALTAAQQQGQAVAEVKLHDGLLYGRLDADLPVGTKLYTAPPSAPVGVEALRLALKWAEVLPPGEPLRKESEADLAAARAALEQENDDA